MQIAIKVIMKDVLLYIIALMHNFTIYTGKNCICMYVIYSYWPCYTIFIYSKKIKSKQNKNQNITKKFNCVTSTRHEPVYVSHYTIHIAFCPGIWYSDIPGTILWNQLNFYGPIFVDWGGGFAYIFVELGLKWFSSRI